MVTLYMYQFVIYMYFVMWFAGCVAGRNTVPEVWGHLGRSKRLKNESQTMGREDAQRSQVEERISVGRTQRADEEKAQGIRVEHDPITDKGSRDKTQVLNHRQG